MKIGRKAWNLELSEYFRLCRIFQIDGEERIDLLESHQVESVSDESGTLEILILCESFELSDRFHARIEHVDVSGLIRIARPCHDPEISILLVH